MEKQTLFVAKYIALGKEWGTEYLKSETFDGALEEIMSLNETVTPEFAACGEFILYVHTDTIIKRIAEQTGRSKDDVYNWYFVDDEEIPEYHEVTVSLLDVVDLFKVNI